MNELIWTEESGLGGYYAACPSDSTHPFATVSRRRDGRWVLRIAGVVFGKTFESATEARIAVDHRLYAGIVRGTL